MANILLESALPPALSTVGVKANYATQANAGIFRAQLGKVKGQAGGAPITRARIAVIGDSTTVGTGAGTADTGGILTVGAAKGSRVAALAREFAARGINVSAESWAGMMGLPSVAIVGTYDPRQVIDAAVTTGTPSLGGNIFSIGSAVNTGFTITPTAGVITDSVSIFGYVRTGAGTVQVTDGTTTKTASMFAAQDGIGRFELTGFSRAAGKTYTITRSTGGGLSFVGRFAYDSTLSQVEFFNGGISGSQASSTNFWQSTAGGVLAPLPALIGYAPHLTIIMLGWNDYNNAASLGFTQDLFISSMMNIINAAKTTGNCMVCLPPTLITSSLGYPIQQVWQPALAAAAIAAGCIVVDHADNLGSYANQLANGLISGDGFHLNASGYALAAAFEANALLN